MALPRKGSRALVVDGVRYRWMSDLPDDMIPADKRVVAFIVQREGGPGARMRARIRWPSVVRAYRAVGKVVSKGFDRAPPFVVAQAIRVAAGRGWDGSADGPEVDLGWLDEVIDWSTLSPPDDGG